MCATFLLYFNHRPQTCTESKHQLLFQPCTNFVWGIIAGDKTPQFPSQKAAHRVKSKTRSMLITFLFFFSMIHWICLLGWDCQQRFPLNALSGVLRHLTESIWLKGFELWCHHMLAHSTLKTQQFWEGFLPHQHNLCSPTVSLSTYIFLWLCLLHKKNKNKFQGSLLWHTGGDAL